MWLRALAPACAVLALASGPVLAQPAANPMDAAAPVEAAPKPALQIKPVEWKPKKIHRSQLRPQLKPALTAAEADDDVYVPPVAAGPSAPAQPAALQPVALQPTANQPVQMATAQGTGQAPAASATNPLPAATLNDFVGKFLGAGVEVALAPAPAEPPRRMSQVEISGDANAFTVKWATMRIGANFKPETVKASQQELTFRPTTTPGRYVAVAPGGSAPAPDATADLTGRSMIVTVNVRLPSGQTSIQRYERTLTERGMDVVFTRTEGGRLIRQVNLTLTRSGGSIWRAL